MIKNIKIGIKLSSKNFDLIPHIYTNKNLIDYIEIILLPEFSLDDIDFLKQLKMPYAIHVPNTNYGINFGDNTKDNNNLNYIKKINRYKDLIKPFCYIIHPESGNIEISIKNLKKLKIKPLAIENMPFRSINGEELLAYDPQSINIFFNRIKDLEFCFDISHAIKSALSKHIDYLSFIQLFLKLKKPIILHLSGGFLNTEIDEHLNLYNCQYKLHEIKKILLDYNSNISLSLETPKNYESNIENDLKNINYFLNL